MQRSVFWAQLADSVGGHGLHIVSVMSGGSHGCMRNAVGWCEFQVGLVHSMVLHRAHPIVLQSDVQGVVLKEDVQSC